MALTADPDTSKASPVEHLPVYAISPSGAVEQPALIDSAVHNLAAAGFDVRLDRAARNRHQRFAGTDAQRIAAIYRAADSRERIIMITRGGYGLTRLLGSLDFERLAAAGKHWAGFSDFTAFSAAMLSRAGAGTWAAPSLVSFSGAADSLDPTTVGTFRDAMHGSIQALGFDSQGPAGVDEEGVLWGGNLEVLASLLGTPWFPQVRGGLLFLEEVGEHPYRVERRLTQLLHAGVIDKQKAVLFGYVNRYKTVPNDRGFDWPDVVRWLRRQTRTPIITGLPFGHDEPKLTLPHGARLGLSTGRRESFLVFPHHH